MAKRQAELDLRWVTDRAYRYLARFETTQAHLRTILDKNIQNKFPGTAQRDRSDIIDQTIDILLERGHLSDRRYGEMMMRQMVQSGKSRSEFVAKVRFAKQIDAGILNDLLEETPYDDDKALINCIAKKRLTSRDPQKAIQYLARKGFDLNEARKSLDQLRSDELDLPGQGGATP